MSVLSERDWAFWEENRIFQFRWRSKGCVSLVVNILNISYWNTEGKSFLTCVLAVQIPRNMWLRDCLPESEKL